MELDPHFCPEEIMSREVELGLASWTSFASSCPSCSLDPHFCPEEIMSREVELG